MSAYEDLVRECEGWLVLAGVPGVLGCVLGMLEREAAGTGNETTEVKIFRAYLAYWLDHCALSPPVQS